MIKQKDFSAPFADAHFGRNDKVGRLLSLRSKGQSLQDDMGILYDKQSVSGSGLMQSEIYSVALYFFYYNTYFIAETERGSAARNTHAFRIERGGRRKR